MLTKLSEKDIVKFTDTLIVLFNDFSAEKLSHWRVFGRDHENTDRCMFFHAGNFDGFMLWLMHGREEYDAAKKRETGNQSKRVDSSKKR